MGVAGVHLVEVGDRVEPARHVADRFPGGDPEGTQHHCERRRDLLAEADAVAEEELVDRVGAGRQGRDVLRVAGVGTDPMDERLHLVVGRGVAGRDRPRQGEDPRVGVRQLHLLARDVRREGIRAVVSTELRRRRRADLRVDRVDGPGAQSEGRDDGAVTGDVDLAGGEPQLARALGVEHEVRGRVGHVERLQVALPEGDVPERDRQDERRALAQGAARDRLGLRPALALPRVEGLAHPVGRALGPDLHHQCVAEASPERRVEAAGEPEVATDADPAGGTAGLRQLGCCAGVAGEPAGDADRTPRPGAGDERDPRRHDGRREDEEDGGRRRRRRQHDQHEPRRRHAATAARRRPHFAQAPEAAAGPGHDEEPEAEVDRQRARHRHQPGRGAQREEQVPPGRHVEGVDHQDGDQQDRQRVDDGREARPPGSSPHGRTRRTRRSHRAPPRPSPTPEGGPVWRGRRPSRR